MSAQVTIRIVPSSYDGYEVIVRDDKAKTMASDWFGSYSKALDAVATIQEQFTKLGIQAELIESKAGTPA